MSAMYFRPVVTYPATRCVGPTFFTRPAAPVVRHNTVVPLSLFSILDGSLAQLDNQLRQAQAQAQAQRQRQVKRPFNPNFDVKEAKEAYSVEGELPGFDAKDIKIEFLDDGHTLQIRGTTVVKEGKINDHATTDKNVEGVTESAVADTVAPAAETAAESAHTSPSETSTLKSHQATVEDDVDEPANASATITAATEQPVPEPLNTTAQQVTEQPKNTTSQAEPKSWVSERYTGSFTRSFRFPTKIDQGAVRASLKDGILAINLPFAEKLESRRIRIE